MKTLHIASLPAEGANASLLGTTLTWLVNQHWKHIEKPEREAVLAVVAQGDSYQMELALQGVLIMVRERQEAHKRYLRGRILQVVQDSPEFFRNESFGRELAYSFLASAAREDAPEETLVLAYQRAELAAELWMKLGQMVELALVDGENMASQLRKALRNPNATLEDDRQVVRRVLARLREACARRSGYGVQQGLGRLCEMLTDAEQPNALLDVVLDEGVHALTGAA
jgi:hypothetical protein